MRLFLVFFLLSLVSISSSAPSLIETEDAGLEELREDFEDGDDEDMSGNELDDPEEFEYFYNLEIMEKANKLSDIVDSDDTDSFSEGKDETDKDYDYSEIVDSDDVDLFPAEEGDKDEDYDSADDELDEILDELLEEEDLIEEALDYTLESVSLLPPSLAPSPEPAVVKEFLPGHIVHSLLLWACFGWFILLLCLSIVYTHKRVYNKVSQDDPAGPSWTVVMPGFQRKKQKQEAKTVLKLPKPSLARKEGVVEWTPIPTQ